jgi:hypothetical protein
MEMFMGIVGGDSSERCVPEKLQKNAGSPTIYVEMDKGANDHCQNQL